ncbi:MAG: DUF938 domain-containing protein, partial [Roseovarius sp.]
MPRRHLPAEIASTVTPGGDARLSAPSAARNAGPIADLLRHHAPAEGRALELAAGTGEHALAFARAFPGLTWQPSEIDPARRASIDAWAATDPQPNLLPAIALDATAPGWGAAHPGHALILLVNLLHLISEPEARALIAGLPQALAPGGRAILYGPFLRDGQTTSEGDARFHASLRAAEHEDRDKDDFDLMDALRDPGLGLDDE